MSSSAFDDTRLLPFALSSLGKTVESIKVSIIVSASPLKATNPNAIKTMDFLSKSRVTGAEFVDLCDGASAKEVVRNSDLILLNGGNPFTLLSVLQSQDYLDELKSLAISDQIWVGVSAGAMIFSPGLHLVQDFNEIMSFDDKGNTENIDNLNCLNLFDEYFFPHYDTLSQKVPQLSEKLNELSLDRKVTIYRQNNGQTATVSHRRIGDIVKYDQRQH